MCYEPGQAAVQTYTRRMYKISTVTIVAVVVEVVVVRVYVCVYLNLWVSAPGIAVWAWPAAQLKWLELQKPKILCDIWG